MAAEKRVECPNTVFKTLGYVAEMSEPDDAMIQVKPEILHIIGPGNPCASNAQPIRELSAPTENHCRSLRGVLQTFHLSAQSTYTSRWHGVGKHFHRQYRLPNRQQTLTGPLQAASARYCHRLRREVFRVRFLRNARNDVPSLIKFIVYSHAESSVPQKSYGQTNVAVRNKDFLSFEERADILVMAIGLSHDQKEDDCLLGRAPGSGNGLDEPHNSWVQECPSQKPIAQDSRRVKISACVHKYVVL